ncbi:2,3-dihydro-2,3-dihydroxybenzoate dehydrogenase [Nocardia tenerifensis]|uniref:2,3-dihydro-2,3-dihydroxybenzoate dehydrogenase n=1 Tax=Nocardia tenerifensis TaxID=228006 RepID=A0A318KCQ5_9NOCA|nr:2,3-dihydro-2,3-dihydroxybenzoate dehydrogenase [Nocardia tenerifensis]PXX69336.1 2,3-dihydro-2,3-dihydroxybenzoate dehydrogenase [Nocardia tenerifensis]
MSRESKTGGGVIITGAAGGIGRAAAELFAARSAVPLVLWDHDPAVHATAAELDSTRTHAEQVDVTDADAVDAAFAAAVDRIGPIESVVHAAGILETGSIAELTGAQWDRCLAVNATGTMNVTRRAAALLAAHGGGSIVVVTSNAASTPRVGMAAYGASKAAATAFAMALGLEVAAAGVRVNLVSPGSTDTPMLRGMWTEDAAELSSAARDHVLAGDPANFRLGIPLRRVAQPEDIAESIYFLTSPGARHITMHDLRVDGGATFDA